jgi:hypothetical protein
MKVWIIAIMSSSGSEAGREADDDDTVNVSSLKAASRAAQAGSRSGTLYSAAHPWRTSCLRTLRSNEELHACRCVAQPGSFLGVNERQYLVWCAICQSRVAATVRRHQNNFEIVSHFTFLLVVRA